MDKEGSRGINRENRVGGPGGPLANLNMEVKDPDTGTNSVFNLRNDPVQMDE